MAKSPPQTSLGFLAMDWTSDDSSLFGRYGPGIDLSNRSNGQRWEVSTHTRIQPDFLPAVQLMIDLALHADGEINRHSPVHRRHGAWLEVYHEQVRSWLRVHDLSSGVARGAVFSSVSFDIGVIRQVGRNRIDAEGASNASNSWGFVEALLGGHSVDAFAGGVMGGDVAFARREAFGCGAFAV